MKTQLNIKIEKSDLKLIKKACKISDNNQSHFVRVSIKKELARLGFLTKQECKILGVEL